MVLRVLAEVPVLLHVNTAAYLFERRSLPGKGLYLCEKIAKVIAETLQLFLSGQIKMTRDDGVQGPGQDLIQGSDPVLSAADIHRGGGPVEKQVSRRDGTLTGEIHQRVSRGVGFAWKINLGGIGIEVDGQLLGES